MHIPGRFLLLTLEVTTCLEYASYCRFDVLMSSVNSSYVKGCICIIMGSIRLIRLYLFDRVCYGKCRFDQPWYPHFSTRTRVFQKGLPVNNPIWNYWNYYLTICQPCLGRKENIPVLFAISRTNEC